MTMPQSVQRRPTPAKGSVPGPRGLPLLGVLLDLVRDPLGSLLAAAREYGGVVALNRRQRWLIVAVAVLAVVLAWQLIV